MSANGSTFEVEYNDRRDTEVLIMGGSSSRIILYPEKIITIRVMKLINILLRRTTLMIISIKQLNTFIMKYVTYVILTFLIIISKYKHIWCETHLV